MTDDYTFQHKQSNMSEEMGSQGLCPQGIFGNIG